MRGVPWALAALLAWVLLAGRVSAQAGTVIVELSTPPAALNLPATAKQTGAAAAAQRVARLGMASAAASSEQASFRTAAAATGSQFGVLHTYRYVSGLLRGRTAVLYCSFVDVQHQSAAHFLSSYAL